MKKFKSFAFLVVFFVGFSVTGIGHALTFDEALSTRYSTVTVIDTTTVQGLPLAERGTDPDAVCSIIGAAVAIKIDVQEAGITADTPSVARVKAGMIPVISKGTPSFGVEGLSENRILSVTCGSM